MKDVMLQVKDLSVNYGHVEALKKINIDVKRGQITSIVGANGAGKSTLLKTISGLVKPLEGEILFECQPIPKRAHKIVSQGIVHVPEGRRTFSGLTITDNLLVGGFLSSGKELSDNIEKQFELFPILRERKNQFAGTLSGGEQQMLAVARGLMSNPKILLLDEPSMGLAPLIVNQIYEIIQKVKDRGITVLLVEQNAKKALSICDYAYVIENGEIKLQGTGEELLNSEEVKKAYLGGK